MPMRAPRWRLSAAMVSMVSDAARNSRSYMTAQSRRAAMLDRGHDLELLKAQVSGLGGPISGADSTENVGDLE